MPTPAFAEGPMQVDLGLMFSAEAADIGTTAEIMVQVLDADGHECDTASARARKSLGQAADARRQVTARFS
jgi:hypothetical protein